MPRLRRVVRVSDLNGSDDHQREGIVDGAWPGNLAHEVAPAGNLRFLASTETLSGKG